MIIKKYNRGWLEKSQKKHPQGIKFSWDLEEDAGNIWACGIPKSAEVSQHFRKWCGVKKKKRKKENDVVWE